MGNEGTDDETCHGDEPMKIIGLFLKVLLTTRESSYDDDDILQQNPSSSSSSSTPTSIISQGLHTILHVLPSSMTTTDRGGGGVAISDKVSLQLLRRFLRLSMLCFTCTYLPTGP